MLSQKTPLSQIYLEEIVVNILVPTKIFCSSSAYRRGKVRQKY